MTPTVEVEGRLTAADATTRTLTGVLIPYGTPGRTSVGRVTASAGALTLPTDPAEVSLNIEHDYTRPIGRASGLSDLEDGLHATFRVAATRAGDDLLEEVREGLRTHLSVEVDNPVISGGRLVGGTLTAAAAVVRPAFAGATIYELTASDTATDEDIQDETPATAPDEIVLDGVRYRRIEDQDEQDTDTDDQEDPIVPDTLQAAAPRGVHTPIAPGPDRSSLRDVTRMFTVAARDHQLQAALSDITVSGAGSIGGDVIPPAWVDELWSGRAFVRRYVPLVANAALTSLTINGWRWRTKPAVAPYAGNKADVPSAPVDTEPVTATAQRLAGAHDVDRSFYDFNVESFWSSYFAAMTESYARLSDQAALDALVAGATPITGGGLLADTTAWSLIVDAALAVIANGGTPSFAVVGSDVYREALLTPRDQTVALLTAALSLEEGDLAGFRIIPSSDTDLTGKALVGARESATFYELPGSPIRIAAGSVVDVSRAGIDVGVLGYFASIINNAATLVLASKPPAAARGSKD